MKCVRRRTKFKSLPEGKVSLIDVALSMSHRDKVNIWPDFLFSFELTSSRGFDAMSLLVVCSTVATVYAISSFVLLRKPQWIHRKRRPAFIARNIGHRGGAAESIENTFLAFDKGLKNGVEMLEIDCHMTKDHRAVVHHDFTLTRTAGQDLHIRDVEYEKLPLIKDKIPLYYDMSKIISETDNSSASEELLRIPLLKDVFERYPTTPINIDIKENNDELIRQVSDLIQQYRREHLTYWGSFSHKICQKLTNQNPRIVRFASMKEAAGIVFAYWTGLLPFLRLTPGAFEVPIPGEVFKETSKNFNWKFRTILYLAERTLNNRRLFTHLQQRGIPVYVWILNNEEEFDYAFREMGVTGVMTDYPTRLQNYLKNKSLEYLL